ncbi:MAG: hypothetical protein H6733_09130 [Alphaproteobacteria bacterium]|nr:hypothetical protein [Alphaproteobacteria bacterium]
MGERREFEGIGQGLMWFDMIPNMKHDKLVLLMNALGELAEEHAGFRLLSGATD